MPSGPEFSFHPHMDHHGYEFLRDYSQEQERSASRMERLKATNLQNLI